MKPHLLPFPVLLDTHLYPVVETDWKTDWMENKSMYMAMLLYVLNLLLNIVIYKILLSRRIGDRQFLPIFSTWSSPA